MPFEYGQPMTGVICHMADLKKEPLKMTQKDNCIVVLKRICEINGTRSIPTLPPSLPRFRSTLHKQQSTSQWPPSRSPIARAELRSGHKASLALTVQQSTTSHRRWEGGRGGRYGKKLREDEYPWQVRAKARGKGRERKRLKTTSMESSLDYSS